MGRTLSVLRVAELFPRTIPRADFSPQIVALAPRFPEIYQQALAAEALGLTEVAGGGYRKAVEFLVKDFCIRLRPEEEAMIRAKRLGQCIADYIDSPEVKLCAERAAWLGNDELHYERVWTAHDLSDLRRITRMLVNWIQNVLETDELQDEMPRPERR